MRSANYVEETTTSIAGTNGDGVITMTGITNTPRFSTVFGVQDTTVRYVIEDTVNKKFETGIGVVASDALTRSRPQITWNGTTYDESTPSPLQFGSSPTSGNIRIRMSATAESQGVVLTGVNGSIAGDSTWRDYPITNNVGWDNNGSGASVSADVEYYTCYLLAAAGLVDSVQIDVVSPASTNGMKSALYSCGTNGLPSKKIGDFALLNTNNSGAKSALFTSTVWLPAGWYYVGFIAADGMQLRGFASNGSSGLKSRTPLGRHGGYGWSNTCSVSGSYSTGMPFSPAPTTMISASGALSVPWLGLKVTP